MLKRPIMCAFALLLMPFIAFSQNYRSGYVVAGKDTVRGYLKEDVESNLLSVVNFSDNSSGFPNRSYTSADIQAFYFNDGSLFKLVSFTDSKNEVRHYFAKYLLKGYYDLYAFRKNDALYFIVTNRDSVYLLYDNKYLTNGQLDEQGNYKQRLLFLSVGCEDISSTLDNLRYSENDLIAFVRKLNACHEPSASSTVFYVKPKSTLNFYVYAAAMPLGDKSEYAARASARFSLSSISKNTSLNVNVVYMSHNTTSSEITKHTQNILSGGASMQYNFLTGRVTPYVEGGIGLAYQTDNDPLFDPAQKFGISLVIAAGMEGYVTKNFVIKADWRYELFTHYPVIGVAWFFK